MSNETLDQHLSSKENIDIKSNGIKFGIIGGLLGIIISLTLFFTDMEMEKWAKWMATLVTIIIIILGIKTIADENKNRLLSFGILFKAGMIMALIISIITVAFFVIHINFIETNFIEKLLNESRKAMAEKGLSEDQIEQAIEMSKTFMSPVLLVIFGFIGSFFFGTMASLIGAAIFKKEK